MISNNLNSYLILAVFLLVAGIYGLIQHRSFIGMLVSTELILNGAGINFIEFISTFRKSVVNDEYLESKSY